MPPEGQRGKSGRLITDGISEILYFRRDECGGYDSSLLLCWFGGLRHYYV